VLRAAGLRRRLGAGPDHLGCHADPESTGAVGGRSRTSCLRDNPGHPGGGGHLCPRLGGTATWSGSWRDPRRSGRV